MASTTTITFRTFNLNAALNGASIGWQSVDNEAIRAYDFRPESFGYSYLVDNVRYYCNANGTSEDGKQLYIIDAAIKMTEGTATTRGESDIPVSIDVLQPRELFANSAMQGVLQKIDNPLELDEYQITQIADVSFKLAQAMMNTAADYRAASGGGGGTVKPEGGVDIEEDSLTSTTDRILYNLQVAMVESNNKAETFRNYIKETGLSIASSTTKPIYTYTSGSVRVEGTVSSDIASVSANNGVLDVDLYGIPSVKINSVDSDIVVPVTVENTPTVIVQSEESTTE